MFAPPYSVSPVRFLLFSAASFAVLTGVCRAEEADDPVSAVVVTAPNPARALEQKNEVLDQARDGFLLTKLGASAYGLDQKALDALPQGQNTGLDKVLLQTPGVSADTAISNPDFHVRNEYANVQYRLNGVQLPDGVSALGSVLETEFIDSLVLLDGVLPAQYGLRTAGVVDMTTKKEFETGGRFDFYGGGWGTISPSLDLGGSVGDTQYFITGRYLQSDQGLENALPTANPDHDRTKQEKLFGYGSTLLGASSRLTYMAGAFAGRFQIPDVTGGSPLGDYGPATLSSTRLNENETDQFSFGLLALQTHTGQSDTQISGYVRSASVRFNPDVYDDLAFNDVASRVTRKSVAGGVQVDAARRLSEANVLRAGLDLSVEVTHVADLSTVLPFDASGAPLPTPITLDDETSRTGLSIGGYVQDEWSLLPGLTLNTGLRFDQMRQFVAANQLSPRLSLIYKPSSSTSLHVGVARYFTPPMQAQATPNRIGLFTGTTQQPTIGLNDPVRPERATYYDIGLDHTVTQALSVGLDVYYKPSHDTLDDGQFGQAVVLQQFNYAKGFSQGLELKSAYDQGGLHAYANFSAEVSKVKTLVSNQYLISDPTAFAYMADHYTYASDAQTLTASWGASWRWRGLMLSLDGIYGSGLRTGFANEQHTAPNTQWNGAVAREFAFWNAKSPLKLRLAVLNLFDRSYILRSGDGVGEFAPQYGPRRGVFVDVSQAF